MGGDSASPAGYLRVVGPNQDPQVVTQLKLVIGRKKPAEFSTTHSDSQYCEIKGASKVACGAFTESWAMY